VNGRGSQSGWATESPFAGCQRPRPKKGSVSQNPVAVQPHAAGDEGRASLIHRRWFTTIASPIEASRGMHRLARAA
jgi:hypothetical protein